MDLENNNIKSILLKNNVLKPDVSMTNILSNELDSSNIYCDNIDQNSQSQNANLKTEENITERDEIRM